MLSKREFTKKLMDWFFDDSCKDGVDFKVAIYKAMKYSEEKVKTKYKKNKSLPKNEQNKSNKRE